MPAIIERGGCFPGVRGRVPGQDVSAPLL